MSIDRFRDAQRSPIAGFAAALEELRTGGKRGHWIWYVFPQLNGLGISGAARQFALHGDAEATEFLRDPDLRARLITITGTIAEALGAHRAASLRALIESKIDTRKLVSSLTLCRHVATRLHQQEGLDQYRALADVADRVLTVAPAEGYPPCVYTLDQLGH